MSNFKKNLILNYGAKFYTAALSILLLPFYIKFLGDEGFGLIGFYMLIQFCLLIFDVGICATMTREVARYNADGISADYIAYIYGLYNKLFAIISACCAIFFILFSLPIAEHWLNPKSLSIEQVKIALILMGCVAAFRFQGGLYRSIISGAEQFKWLTQNEILISTLKFVFPFLLFAIGVVDIVVYFTYQLLLSIFELLIVYRASRIFLPFEKTDKNIKFSEIIGSLKFSGVLAVTSIVWVLMTQADKFLLSDILSLSEFGVFTLIVSLANGITVIAGPLGNVIQPRLTSFISKNEVLSTNKILSNSLRGLALAIIPVASIFIFFGDIVLMGWTGSESIANNGGETLAFYSLGNLFLALNSFAYYLQYATGKLKLHFRGNIISTILFLPILYFAVHKYGQVGAGKVWAANAILYSILWVPYIFKKVSNIKFLALCKVSVAPYILIFFGMSYVARQFFDFSPDGQIQSIIFIGCFVLAYYILALVFYVMGLKRDTCVNL